VHTHKPYADLAPPDLPVTERVAAQSLSLPIWSHMPLETVDRICAAMVRIHTHADEVRGALGD
jgi:dTDP-4-amino-4,6-dideoxygalactose transaminase